MVIMTSKKYADIKKSLDRGPREFTSRKVEKEGNVMYVAERSVVTTQPNNSLKNVARLMKGNDFRRIPVTDAGTGRLEGIAVAIDIIDFMGGGEKYNIIKKDYNGNFLAAINCPINKIMAPASYLDRRSTLDDVIRTITEKKTSAIPIVDDEESLKVIAIVTERDVLPITDGFGVTIGKTMQKKCITATPGMMVSDVSKVMVRNRLRRLPVIREDELVGIVTVFDILHFLGYGDFKDIDAEKNLSTRVSRIMKSKVVSVTPKQDLAVIPKLVKETNLGGFPVVENGNLVGIVTITDVLKWVYRG